MKIVTFNIIGGKTYECDSSKDESGEYVKIEDVNEVFEKIRKIFLNGFK